MRQEDAYAVDDFGGRERPVGETAGGLLSFPGQLVASSTPLGWTSLAVRRFTLPAHAQPFEVGASANLGLSITLTGRYRLVSRSGGRRYAQHYGPGVACLRGAGTISTVQWDSESPEPIDALHLLLSRDTIGRVTDGFGSAAAFERGAMAASAVVEDPLLPRIARELLDGVSEERPELYGQSAALFLALHVLSLGSRPFAGELERLRSSIRPRDHRVATAIEFMRAQYMKPLGLEDLARVAGVSSFYLIELFRKAVRTTPYRYLTKLRLEAAAGMLATSDRTVLQVALATGYGSAGHLAAAFRQHFKQSPTQYRATKRQR